MKKMKRKLLFVDEDGKDLFIKRANKALKCVEKAHKICSPFARNNIELCAMIEHIYKGKKDLFFDIPFEKIKIDRLEYDIEWLSFMLESFSYYRT